MGNRVFIARDGHLVTTIPSKESGATRPEDQIWQN